MNDGKIPTSHDSIENLGHEERTFSPSISFAKNANAQNELYDEAERDRLAFWEKQAKRLHWYKP